MRLSALNETLRMMCHAIEIWKANTRAWPFHKAVVMLLDNIVNISFVVSLTLFFAKRQPKVHYKLKRGIGVGVGVGVGSMNHVQENVSYILEVWEYS